MNVELTTLDTKPILCNYGSAITGYAFVLDAVCAKTGHTVTINGMITDSAVGTFQFVRTESTFQIGLYSATIRTIFPDTTDETSSVFYIDVHGRII